MRTTIQVAARSDVGRQREENQDRILTVVPDVADPRHVRGILLAVADGMGGLHGGSVASRITAETLESSYYASSLEPLEALGEGVRAANEAIHRLSQESGTGEAMGSTVTAFAWTTGNVQIAQVGDSRAYLFRDGALRQITKDHTLLRELLDTGHLRPDMAEAFRHRNVLTRGVGLLPDVEVDLYEISDARAGDLFVLSSDGLHEVLGDGRLAELLGAHDDLESLCGALIEEACHRGGPDNISVVLARVRSEEERGGEPGAARRSNGAGRAPLVPLAIFLAFAAGAAVMSSVASLARDRGHSPAALAESRPLPPLDRAKVADFLRAVEADAALDERFGEFAREIARCAGLLPADSD